jgi:hypothetical protein
MNFNTYCAEKPENDSASILLWAINGFIGEGKDTSYLRFVRVTAGNPPVRVNVAVSFILAEIH